MIKYDSEIAERLIKISKETRLSIESDISSKLLTDYEALLSVNLFSDQLYKINDFSKKLIESFESFESTISKNKNDWGVVKEESVKGAKNYSSQVANSGTKNININNGGSSSHDTSKYATTSTDVNKVSKGKEISNNDVKEMIGKLDSTLLPILLQRVNKLKGDENLVSLLTDVDKSNILTKMLRRVLGDTADEDIPVDLDTGIIQKMLLSKLNAENIDVTTPDGKSAIEQKVLEQLNTQVDESKWNEVFYGDNIIKISALEGNWIVAKTNQNLDAYLSYIANNGVRQNANTDEWGDSCLAFAGAHTYDLYSNIKTNGPSAASYAHAGQFADFMSDSKQETLTKIYDEILNGRPVVLQVNGNKQGTSRHFVTVVGFKEGVVSGATLKEEDLLIIDSWDGKLERMDTEKSRFMTTGAACHKEYSGYRLRVLKS